jgi:hypothetical protein
VVEVTLSKRPLSTNGRLPPQSFASFRRDVLRREIDGDSPLSRPKARPPGCAANANHGATSSAFISFKNTKARMACVNTAAPDPSCEKSLPRRIVFEGATAGRFLYGCSSERSGARKMWSGRIGSSKVNDHDVFFTCDDITLGASDRLHGTTPALLLPKPQSQRAANPDPGFADLTHSED